MTRLARTKLLFGADAVKKLQNATVMVVGCGAVGSFAVEALARTGVGNLVLVDCDTVAESNINRQLIALDSTLGRSKVSVAAARIHDINPDINVVAINMFFDASSELDIRPDFVIDAIDTVPSKIDLYQWCNARNIPFVASMGAGRKTDPTQIRIAKLSKTTVCPLASRVRKLAREHGIPDFDVVYSAERPCGPADGKEFGSLITVTGVFGLMLAGWVINHITGICQNGAICSR